MWPIPVRQPRINGIGIGIWVCLALAFQCVNQHYLVERVQTMKEQKQDQGPMLIGFAILLCIGTLAVSGIMALVAASNSEFMAAGICMIPASISSSALLYSVS